MENAIATDQQVHVKGRVVRARVGDQWPIEMQFVTLALSDGQALETNVRNLAEFVASDKPVVTDVQRALEEARRLLKMTEDALAGSRAEAYAMQAELSAMRELLRIAETRANSAEQQLSSMRTETTTGAKQGATRKK